MATVVFDPVGPEAFVLESGRLHIAIGDVGRGFYFGDCLSREMAQILQAVVDAGLAIETVREYPYANGCQLFEGMTKLEGRRFAMPAGAPAMPLMFGLVARA